jgi:hypothetical protein
MKIQLEQEKWSFQKISCLRTINRQQAKSYAKYCEFCKEYFDSGEKLFLLFIRTYETKDDYITDTNNFVNDCHLFTEKALNDRLHRFNITGEERQTK